MSDEKCLFCIPLKSGVRAIAILQVVIIFGIFATGLLYPSLLLFCMPMVFAYMLISVGFFFESCYRSQASRRNLLIAYVVLIVLFRNLYYF